VEGVLVVVDGVLVAVVDVGVVVVVVVVLELVVVLDDDDDDDDDDVLVEDELDVDASFAATLSHNTHRHG